MRKFKRWFRKRKRPVIITVVLLFAGIGAAFAFGVFDKEKQSGKPTGEPSYSQLTGMEVSSEEAERPILAIMVENSPFARPQTGVGSAGIVFESVTEGGITRYLTLYQENLPSEVGPVRSIRPYFVNWLMGFDASVAHVGGSSEALDLVEQRDAKTLSQFAYPEPYYRSAEREAPHNMYVRTADLLKLQKDLGHQTAQFKEIPRSRDKPVQTPDAPTITIDYSSPDYAVEFRYDTATNAYLRFLASEPDIDAGNNAQIRVKNVVLIKMNGTAVDALDSGEAVVFKDGTAISATWEQDSYQERILITDDQGKEVPFNRGNTWFAVLPASGSASY